MKDKNQVKINVPPDKLEARYSDIAVIAKNALGFNMDFGQRMPGNKQVNIVARIAMSPQHAKLFAKVLEQNIEDYEKKFGEIQVPKKAANVKDGEFIHFVK